MLLNEFLNSHADRLVRDPLSRAVFQRNLIGVFHWAAEPIIVGDHSMKCCAECRGNAVGCYKERRQLAELLAAMIKAVATSADEIRGLPDNYRALKATKTADELYLPCGPGFTLIARDDGMAAPIHLSNFPMSEFLVYLRLPPTGPTTTKFIEATLSLANWYGVKIQRNVTLLHRSKTTIRQPQVHRHRRDAGDPRQTFTRLQAWFVVGEKSP